MQSELGPNDAPASEPFSERDFMRLFVRHEPALRAFARSICPNWDVVDDALQEASVTMWEKLDQLRDSDGFLPWAKVILRFKCLSAVAKARRDRCVLSEHVLELIADESEKIGEQEVSDIRATLRVCLANFSHSHQQLLLAPYSGDGEVKRLAEQGNKSANSMYKLLGRLREKLATCMNGKLNLENSIV